MPTLAKGSVCFLWLLAVPLLRQTGSIQGIVKDQTEASIVGAQVEVTNIDNGLRRDTKSNEAGLYTVQCDNDLNNFAPRLGFAYRIRDKTVLRAGVEIIYARRFGADTMGARSEPGAGFFGVWLCYARSPSHPERRLPGREF